MTADGKTVVFISYSRRDASFCTKLAQALADRGYTPSFDQFKRPSSDLDARLTAQDDWWAQLKVMIANCDVMVLVVSPFSAASPICDDEIAHARKLGKRVIPILREPIDFNSAPERLRALNVQLDFTSDAGSPFSSAMAALAVELDTDVPWLRYGARLMLRAEQWDVDGRPEGQLLRAGAIAEAQGWALRRPKDAPEPGPLLVAFLDASRAKENGDTARLRQITARAFVGPVQVSVAEGKHVEAVRLAAAGMVLSGDRELSAAPELWNAVVPAIHGLRLIAALDIQGKSVLADFANAGQRLITSSDSGPTDVWSIPEVRHLRSVGDPSSGFCFAVSPDGERLATSASDQPISIWRIEDGALLARSSTGLATNKLCFSPDGGIVWGLNGACSADSGLTLTVFEPGFRRVSIHPSPDGLYLAIVEDAQLQGVSLLLLATDTNRIITRIDLQYVDVIKLLFAPDSRAILVVTESRDKFDRGERTDSAVRMFEVPSGRLSKTFEADWGCINDAAFSPDGLQFATAMEGTTVRVWDVSTGARRSLIESSATRGFYPPASPAELVFDRTGKLIMGASLDGSARIWCSDSGRPLLSLPHGNSASPVVRVSSADGGRRALTAGRNGVRVWDLALSNKRFRFEDRDGPVKSVSFSRDGRLLAQLAANQKLLIRDLQSGKCVATLAVGYPEELRCFFTPDGKALVAMGSTGEFLKDYPDPRNARQVLQVWTIDDWKLVKEISDFGKDGDRLSWPPSRFAEPGAMSRATQMLSDHGVNQDRDSVTRKLLTQIGLDHGQLFNSAGAADDAKSILLCNVGQGPALYSCNTGKLLYRLAGAPDVNDASLSADGNYLSLAQANGTTVLDVSRCKLLDAPADVLFAALTAGGVGHLTEQERTRPLLQEIPPDLHIALVSEMAADQIEKAAALMRRLRAPRELLYYEAPQVT